METTDTSAQRDGGRAGVKIGAVVLAAGSSSRLGQPKQLLEYEGQSLVRRAAQAALDAGCDPVAVVVGHGREKVIAALHELPATLVPNDDWERGIGASIRAGVDRLRASDALILLVCDQPKVDASLLRELIAGQEQTGQPMVATRYASTQGVPALFTRDRFAQLLSLGDETGAKRLLLARPAEVATVDFPAAAWDIDTPADLRSLDG